MSELTPLEASMVEWANELKQLLQENVLKDPDDIPDEVAARILEIQRNIVRAGWAVEKEYGVTIVNGEPVLEVTITLLKPKANMSPEARAIYNQWRAERLGLSLITDTEIKEGA